MAYDADTDTYTCANNKNLGFDYVKKSKSKNGFETEIAVYSCKECEGCPLKAKCIKACGSKKPLEERNKVIYVSKRFARQREEMEQKINTDEGKLIRVNRSIQSEGSSLWQRKTWDFEDSCCEARQKSKWSGCFSVLLIIF